MTSVSLKIVAATLVGGMLAVGVIPALTDWSSLRPGIERAATAAVGWPVTVTGPISARLLPAPAMILRQVTVGRAGFETVRLDLGVWPLLAGRIAVSGVDLAGGRLGGGAGLEGQIHLGEIFAAEGRFEGGFTAQGRLTAGGITVPIEVEGGRPGGGAAVPLRARLGLPGGEGSNVRIEATLLERRIQGTAQVNLPSLARALPGAALPDLPLTAEGRLVVTGEEAGLQGIILTLGESRAEGEIVAALGTSPVAVDVSLRANTINLDQAPAAPTPVTTAPTTPPPAPLPAPPAGGSAAGLRLPLPANLTLNLDLAAESVHWRGGLLRQPRLNALLDDGKLTVSHLSAQLPGATNLDFNGLVTIEERGPLVAGRLRLASSDPSRLRRWLWPERESGSWPASVRLEANLEAGSDRLILSSLLLGLETLRLSGSLAWTDALTAQMKTGGLEVRFDGEPGAGAEAGALTLKGPSFAEAVRLLMPDYRPLHDGPVALTARLARDEAGPWLDQLRLTAADNTLTGQIRFPTAGPIALHLSGEAVRLDPFLSRDSRTLPSRLPRPPVRALGGGGEGSEAAPPPAVPRGKVEAEPLSRLPAATVALTLGQLTLRGLTLAPFSADLTVAGNGSVTINPLKAKGWGGSIEGQGRFGSDGVFLALTLSGLDAGQLALSAGRLGLSGGRLEGQIRLSAAGLAPNVLAATLGGEARLTIRNGEIRGIDLAAINARLDQRDLAGVLKSGLQGGQTRFSVLSASLKATQGTLASPDLLLAAEGARVTGAGTLDLPAQRIDAAFRLAPAAAGLPPLGLGVQGRLDGPDVVFDANALQRAWSSRR